MSHLCSPTINFPFIAIYMNITSFFFISSIALFISATQTLITVIYLIPIACAFFFLFFSLLESNASEFEMDQSVVQSVDFSKLLSLGATLVTPNCSIYYAMLPTSSTDAAVFAFRYLCHDYCSHCTIHLLITYQLIRLFR